MVPASPRHWAASMRSVLPRMRGASRLRRRSGAACERGEAMSGHLGAFLEMLTAERNAAANTSAAYRRDLEDVGVFLAKRGRDLSAATTEDLRAYLSQLAANDVQP